MPGWEEVASAASGKYLILGESHGSAEAPAATAEYVCAVAKQGPVLLAIEFSSRDNAGFQRAWNAPHAEFRQRLFAEVSDWGTRPDGVASTAMLTMLERLHALKTAGRQIDIVAFNGASGDAQRAAFAELPGQEPHEAAQAANIREAAQARGFVHIVVLGGNLHARKTPTTLRGLAVRPMANLLARSDRVISLNMHSEGGETWSCYLKPEAAIDPAKPITNGMIECGPSSSGASRPELPRGFHLDASLAPGRYDGVFALGPVTASPPPSRN